MGREKEKKRRDITRYGRERRGSEERKEREK